MIDQPLSESEKEQLQAILDSRKYRDLAIPGETAESLYRQALLNGNAPREALKSVRQKLHNIVAPYLGDANFEEAAVDLDAAFKEGDENEIKSVCTRILESHASTRERLGIMETFYSQIFSCDRQATIDPRSGVRLESFRISLDGTAKFGQLSRLRS